MKKNALLSLVVLSLMAFSSVNGMDYLKSLYGQFDKIPGSGLEKNLRVSAGATLAARGGFDVITSYFGFTLNPLIELGAVATTQLAAMYFSGDYDVVTRGLAVCAAWKGYDWARGRTRAAKLASSTKAPSEGSSASVGHAG